MGCKLVRGETIYFVRHGGRKLRELDCEWLSDGYDQRLLPSVYTRSDGHESHNAYPAAIPIEIRTFEGS